MATSSLKAISNRDFDYWKAHHLLNRAGFGGTPSQVRALANMGLDGAVDHLVDFDEVEAPAVEADEFDSTIMRPATQQERRMLQEARRAGNEDVVERFRKDRQKRQRADRRQMAEIQQWWLKRMIETRRPLEEKMTLFWHGHFATSYRGIEDSYHLFLQNQFFRANAVGSFADLVCGIVRDPAMLKYLNNDQNRKQKPNENLARELMELFVLGEGNAYTENDIKEGARALTGHTFEDDRFLFRANWHDDQPKRICGKVGNWDGTDFCNIILSQRAASEFICWKLYRYFVNDLPGNPPADAQAFIVKLAKRLRDRKYSLKSVLKTLFKSEHFYDASNVACQIKSPMQLLVQAIRSLSLPPRNLRALLNAADMMGQHLFLPPSVKGWDGGRAWINTTTLFVRHNVMIYLLTGRKPDAYAWQADGTPTDLTHIIEHLTPETGQIDTADAMRYLLRFTLGVKPPPERVDTLVGFVNEGGGRLSSDMLTGVLSLVAAMPEYQLC